MSLKRLRSKLITGCILIFAFGVAHRSVMAAQPHASVGPADPVAAETLFKEAQSQIRNQQYTEASRSLERLLARYPSHSSNLEARLLLGRSYIETNRAAEAIRPLQEYLSRVKPSAERISARLTLIRAYQALSKPHEVMIAAKQVLSSQSISPMTRAQTLIDQGQAQFALKNRLQAKRSLDQAQAILKTAENESPEDRTVHANLESLRLKLQLDQCNSISDVRKPSESVAMGVITRSGQCLMQSLLTFNALTQWEERELSEASIDSICDSYSKLKRFLVDQGKGASPLVEKYDRYIDESLEMISHWKSTSLPLKERTLSKMRDRLQTLRLK